MKLGLDFSLVKLNRRVMRSVSAALRNEADAIDADLEQLGDEGAEVIRVHSLGSGVRKVAVAGLPAPETEPIAEASAEPSKRRGRKPERKRLAAPAGQAAQSANTDAGATARITKLPRQRKKRSGMPIGEKRMALRKVLAAASKPLTLSQILAQLILHHKGVCPQEMLAGDERSEQKFKINLLQMLKSGEEFLHHGRGQGYSLKAGTETESSE